MRSRRPWREREGRPSLLDIAQTCDCIDYEVLWTTLRSTGLPGEWLTLLEVYTDNLAPVGALRSSGKAMSLLLFMLHTSSLTDRLTMSRLGFNLAYTEQRQTKSRRLPSLLYMDDAVRMAELQALIGVCAEEAAKSGLRFTSTSVAMREPGQCLQEGQQEPKTDTPWLQGSIAEECHAYRYSGIKLTAGRNTRSDHGKRQ